MNVALSRTRRRLAVLVVLLLATTAALLSALPAAASARPAGPMAAAAAIPAGTGQVVSVQAAPGSSYGSLVAWQRQASGSWSVVQGPVQVRLGARGLGPAREGSTYTPEGTYPLTESFGRLANPGTRMPYFKTDTLDWWDGEISSPTYNRHIRSATSPGGASENLYRAGAVYDLAVNIGYNLNPTVPGGGSAFFVHITDGNATAGCVALPRADMTQLLTWLDPAQNPQISLTTGAAWTPPASDRIPGEGEFFRAEGGTAVYRSVGGAAVYVDSWTPFAGQTILAVQPSVIGRMRSVPADGTFVATAGEGKAYVYAGGAAVYVDDWAPFGGIKPSTVVSANAVNAAGSGAWSALRRTPADGTFVAAAGKVYTYVGGAAVYIDSWAPFGGVRPYSPVSPNAISAAGWGPWAALRSTPADGTFVATAGEGKAYRYAGGAAVYVDSWAPFGGVPPYAWVTPNAVNAAGWGPWAALRSTPADGTFVATAGEGKAYRYAGGAAVYVDSWAPFGGPQPYTFISANAVNAAGWGPWSALRRAPADGTFLIPAGTGTVYVMVGGAPVWVDSWSTYGGPKPVVAVSASALSTPGVGPWATLRAAPADGSFARVPDGRVYTFVAARLVHVPSWNPYGGPQPTTMVPVGLLSRAGTGLWSAIKPL